MIDTPQANAENNETKGDLQEHRPVPLPTDTTQPTKEKDKPKQNRNYSQYAMRPLKAFGKGITSTINWLDQKDGFVTAVATVVIAILTSIYVHYSHAQWAVMQGQLGQMQTQTQVMQGQLTQMQLQLPELQKSAKAAQDSASLTRHSVVGAEAAIVQGGIAVDGTRGLMISFYNAGKAVATGINGVFTVSRKNPITGKLLAVPKIITVTVPQIKGQDARGNGGYDWRVLDPTFIDTAPITQFKETIIVDGVMTFNDGFDDIVPVRICYQFLPNINSATGDYIGYVPIECASAKSWIDNLKFQAAKAKASQPK